LFLLHGLAARNDRLTAALLHELFEGQLEAVLAAIGADSGPVVGNAGESAIKHRSADATARRFLLEGADPGLKPCRSIAALRSQNRRRCQNRDHGHTSQDCLHCPHQNLPSISFGEFIPRTKTSPLYEFRCQNCLLAA
jgi:hypothetical protein